MAEIQIITLDGQPVAVAVAVAGSATVGDHVAPARLAHVQAKALYALQIQAGELTGPYTDAGAERYARQATAAHPPPSLRPRTRRSSRRGGRRPR